MNRLQFIVGAASSFALPLICRAAGGSIDEQGYVSIGGIDQWIAIQGDVNNPAIIYLHGGPAEAQSPFLAEFAPWEKYFTVVNWDQRGSGKTLERNGTSTPDVTVERMALDAVEVAQYAARRLEKPKVIVVCQSFGCLLGLNAVRDQPDAFFAYVGTGQPVQWQLSLAAREAFARQQMTAAHDTAALRALEAAQRLPPDSAERLAASNHWRWAPSDLAYLHLQDTYMKSTPASDQKEAQAAWMAGGAFSGPKLFPEITAFDARKLTSFSIPIYVIQGREDHIASNDAAKAWVDSLHAPAKEFVTIDGGHFACFTDPTQFVTSLVQLTTVHS